jgi:hypothetical protein
MTGEFQQRARFLALAAIPTMLPGEPFNVRYYGDGFASAGLSFFSSTRGLISHAVTHRSPVRR